MKARKLSNAATLVIIAVAMLIFGLVAIQTNAGNRKRTAEAPPSLVEPISQSAVPASAALSPADDENKGFWLVLRASGFEVKEMTISAGEYLVVVQNASGLDQFGVRMDRETGERLHEVRLLPLKKRWRQLIRFTPGNYIVSEADHPEWNCRITVTPRP